MKKKLAMRDDNLLKTKINTNKQILKTIALKQLRAAYKIHQSEEKIQYQQKISMIHDEKLTQKLLEAKETADKPFSSTQKDEKPNPDKSLQKLATIVKNDQETEKRILFLTQQKKLKISEDAKKKAEKTKETIERHNRQYNEKIAQMQQR